MNNKTVTLTPDEVKMIQDDIESTRDHFDAQLTEHPTLGYDLPEEEKEEAIESIRVAENILKKLE